MFSISKFIPPSIKEDTTTCQGSSVIGCKHYQYSPFSTMWYWGQLNSKYNGNTCTLLWYQKHTKWSAYSIFFKIFESLLFKRHIGKLTNSQIIPYHQFGFRIHYITIRQPHRVTDKLSMALKLKLYEINIFLNIAQPFDSLAPGSFL